MRFRATPLAGAFIVEPELLEDERGFFARTFCRCEFEERGLNPCVAQCSVSYNRRRATLRGMHYQAAPHEEDKLVRCIRGAIYDVIVDLRPSSATFKRWTGAELSETNRLALYIPRGCAHGFITLADDSEILYQISEYYVAQGARGVRWNDPAFGIVWPLSPTIISDRDCSYEDFKP
jgi:dTDP-4-dehydrorhamnose 3,5-epimerase